MDSIITWLVTKFSTFLLLNWTTEIFWSPQSTTDFFQSTFFFCANCLEIYNCSIKVAIDPTIQFFHHYPKHCGQCPIFFTQCPISNANLGDQFFFIVRLGDWKFCVVTMATKRVQPNFLAIAQKHLSTNQNLLGNNQWPLSIGQLQFFWQLTILCLGGPKEFNYQLWQLKVGDWKLFGT